MLTNPYNPDVLTCLANLSSDEVFTPPKLANEMLDQLPSELWSDPEAKFLDPFCKSGVFLREIAKRLIEGLTEAIPDQEARINHIFKKQLYGIAITELTSLLARRSLYCSKIADGEYSICDQFTDVAGNIRFERVPHTWENGRCSYCGANQENYERDGGMESHAYEFIHTQNPEEIFNMKFDVIIGNPPYQLSDGGHSRSASPIYNKFVQQAKKLNPRYLVMVIPARWYAGGKGLDNFRKEMLNDRRIRVLVDFKNSSSVFPGVDIAGGICYFLWDSSHDDKCEVINCQKDGDIRSSRELNEFPIFIRDSRSISIINKIHASEGGEPTCLNTFVSPSKPFGMRTFYKPKKQGTPCWFIQKIGKSFCDPDDISDKYDLLGKWKLLLPAAPIAGQTDFSKPVKFYYDGNIRIAKPGECCTESWIVGGAFDTEKETAFFKSYLFTKTIRFLLLQAVISQHVVRNNFMFIPHIKKYTETYTDEKLIERWGISPKEWDLIDNSIT